MNASRTRPVVSVVAVLATMCCAAAAPVPRFVVAPIRYALDADDRVGRRQSGLLCTPAGSVRWRDAKPDDHRAAAIVAHVLKDAGADVYVPDDEWLDERAPTAPARIVASIAAMQINACTRQFGVSRLVDHRATLKGSGRIRVRWRVYDLATRTRLLEVDACERFDFAGDHLTLAQASEIGLGRSAAAVAGAIARMAADGGAAPVASALGADDCPPSTSRPAEAPPPN